MRSSWEFLSLRRPFTSLLCHRRERSLAEVFHSFTGVAEAVGRGVQQITHATHVWPPVVITVNKTACSRQSFATEWQSMEWQSIDQWGLSFCRFLQSIWIICDRSLPAFGLELRVHGINGGCRGKTYLSVRGEILRPLGDELMRRHFPSIPSSIKN